MKSVGLFICFVAIGSCTKIPSYFHVCSLSDPNLNKCALESASKTFSVLINGDRKLKIPPLKGFKIKEVNLNTGPNLKIKCTDVVVRGLENIVFQDIKLDIRNNGTVSIKTFFPKIYFIMNYKIDGQILILPITGEGPAEISYDNFTANVNININIVEKSGKKYLRKSSSKFDYVAEKIQYRFEKLFSGDKRLGDAMNSFLNENWMDIDQEVGVAIRESWNTITGVTIFDNIDRIPLEQLFNS